MAGIQYAVSGSDDDIPFFQIQRFIRVETLFDGEGYVAPGYGEVEEVALLIHPHAFFVVVFSTPWTLLLDRSESIVFTLFTICTCMSISVALANRP